MVWKSFSGSRAPESLSSCLHRPVLTISTMAAPMLRPIPGSASSLLRRRIALTAHNGTAVKRAQGQVRDGRGQMAISAR
jgi:hypothetical protein